MAIEINMDKGLDKAYESSSLAEILSASPAALAGVSDADADALKAAFNIKTVRDLGTNKYFALAGVLVALENKI